MAAPPPAAWAAPSRSTRSSVERSRRTLSSPARFEARRRPSGTAHADNVAPSVLGGIVLIRASDPLDLIRLPVPDALRVVLVHPHAQVLTAEARRLVAERRFTIGQAVANLGNVAAVVAALHSGDLALLGRSIQDALVEPIRAPLVPAFAQVKRAALDAGALGCSISGSGPSVLAFADGDASAAVVADAMEAAFTAAGLESDRYVGPVNTAGARVLGGIVNSFSRHSGSVSAGRALPALPFIRSPESAAAGDRALVDGPRIRSSIRTRNRPPPPIGSPYRQRRLHLRVFASPAPLASMLPGARATSCLWHEGRPSADAQGRRARTASLLSHARAAEARVAP